MNHSDTLKNNRILIMDDNPSIHDDIRKILGGEGERNEALEQQQSPAFRGCPAPIRPHPLRH